MRVVLVRHAPSAPDGGWATTTSSTRCVVAIASGGRAISAVVAALTGADGFAFWRSLRTPDVIVLDRDEQGRWVASKP